MYEYFKILGYLALILFALVVVSRAIGWIAAEEIMRQLGIKTKGRKRNGNQC